jgi:hypothetical protein
MRIKHVACFPYSPGNDLEPGLTCRITRLTGELILQLSCSRIGGDNAIKLIILQFRIPPPQPLHPTSWPSQVRELGVLQNTFQTESYGRYQYHCPDADVFIEDVFVVEMKSNHCKADASHESGYRTQHFFSSVHTGPFLSKVNVAVL